MLPERFHRLRRVLDRRQPDLTLLMERVNKPHNLAAILRNCDAVGILEVHAVPPERGLAVQGDTSGGTGRWIRVQSHPEGPTAIRTLQDSGFQVVAAHPGREAMDFRDVDYTQPTAFMLGAELFGISEPSLALADLSVRIPMLGMAHSLNVSVAASLLLYEALRQREAAGMYDSSRLDPVLRRRLLFEWAYPKLAHRLRQADRAYPELDEEGQILPDDVEGSGRFEPI